MNTTSSKAGRMTARTAWRGWLGGALAVWLGWVGMVSAQTGGGEGGPSMVFRHWKHTTVEVLSKWNPNDERSVNWRQQRVRLIGWVSSTKAGGPGEEDQFQISDTAGYVFDVRAASFRPMVNDWIYILGTVQVDIKGRAYLQEYQRFQVKGKDLEDLREWMDFNLPSDKTPLRYADENCFRRFVVLNKAGEPMPPLGKGEWEKGTETRIDDIEEWISTGEAIRPPNGQTGQTGQTTGQQVDPPPNEKTWLEENGLWLVIIAVLLILIFGAMIIFRNGGGKGGGNTGGSTTTSGGRDKGDGDGSGKGSGEEEQPPQKPLRDTGFGDPDKTNVLEDGSSLLYKDQTQVLCGYSLKILSGGTSAGLTLYLGNSTLLGKAVDDYKGYFIKLHMDDRPELAQHCSRHYAKITHRGDALPAIFDVEVVNSSGNPVTVNGETIRRKGATLSAQVGSRIKLMPDWEFEIV
ncbi:MAG: hypothetical protein ACOX5G_14150 [Kiritimatiellia bacterium]|jgi:hypothetical protein